MASSRSDIPLVLATAALLALVAPAQAEEHGDEAGGDMGYPAADQWQLPEPDTSAWRCSNCPFAEGLSGSIELGGGEVSDDSFEFGNYRGLEEEGGFAILEGDLLYRDGDAGYVDFLGEDLGLDSRSMRVEGGVQGRYGAWFEYDQLPHYIADDTRTVFSGAGSSNLDLPAGWVRAGTTGGMTELDASLRGVDIEQERESVGLGADLLGGDHWRFNVEAREDTVEGNRVQGGSFLFNSALLPAPVEYKTERVDASVAYVRERWQLEAAVHTSMFTNENESLTWDNPFTSGTGADQGRLALEPDNQFNQVRLSGSWRSRGTLTVAGQLALGEMEQDEDFLAPTVNGSLAAPALPRNDLDGKVNTRSLDLRITGRPTAGLTARGEVFYDERDNDTPRDAFVQVVTDSLAGTAEVNRPYGYERSGGEVGLDYRVSSALTLAGALGHERVDREFQDADRTETDTVWVEARGRPASAVGLRARQTFEDRDSDYEPFEPDAGDNPDLRSFYLAERDRSATLLAADVLIGDSASAAVSLEFGEDDYTETDIGLVRSDYRSVAVDLTLLPAEGVSVYGFVALQQIDAVQRGADNVTGTPWVADQQDKFDTLGLGLEVLDLPGKWGRGGLNLTFASGTGRLTVEKGGSGDPFPKLKTGRSTAELFAERTLGKDLDLRLGYLVEDLRQDDFYIDQVDPDTIPSVLTLGDQSADDTVHVIQASVRYEF